MKVDTFCSWVLLAGPKKIIHKKADNIKEDNRMKQGNWQGNYVWQLQQKILRQTEALLMTCVDLKNRQKFPFCFVRRHIFAFWMCCWLQRKNSAK